MQSILKGIANALTSLMARVPDAAAAVIAAVNAAVAAAADLVINVLNGIVELLDRLAKALDDAFSS